MKTPRGANLLGQLFCVLFFFDDYANALITGPVLRPIADKVGLSRERLAYIVDSTAAPVAGIAVVSSWVAVEIAVISSGLETAGIADSAFQVFPSLYPLLLLLHFCSCVHAHHQFHRQGIRPYAQSGAPRQSRAKRRMSEKL